MSRTRPLFAVTLLACTMTLTACLDGSCGITSPDEATGSHEGDSSGSSGTRLVVMVRYEPHSGGAKNLTVISTKGGSLTVGNLNSEGPGTFILPDVRVGEPVGFTIIGVEKGASAFCTWRGTTRIFFDAAIAIEADTDGERVSYTMDCVGW